MRYTLESTLPINAFSPRGGRGPFTRGMTLEGGGGGGGVFGGVTDAISNVLGTAGGESGILGGLANFDKGVSNSIPGGWGGLAEMTAIMAASSIPVVGPFAAAGLRGVFDYTHGGEDRKNAFRNAGEQLVVSYGGQYGGALGAGATKAGLQYTHGGADRENAAKSGIITAGTQLAMQGIMNGARTDGGAPVTDNSDYGYTPDVAPDVSFDAPTPDVAPDVNAPDISAPNVYNDGYSPDISPDYVQVPGELGLNIQPADSSLLGAFPTSNILTDMPPGTQFEGPNGSEIVAPNGKTYLMKDLESAYLNQSVVTPTAPDVAPDVAPTETLTNIANTTPKSVVDTANDFSPAPTNKPAPVYDFSTPASPETQKMADMGMMDRLAQMPSYTYDAAAQYAKSNPLTTAALAYGAYNMLGGQQQPQQQPTGQPTEQVYTPPYYGTATPSGLPYILKNRVNASNVYNRTAPTSRYAEGGEVQHFAGGGIANTLTRTFQPLEKAILQPIGKIPGVKEVLPYAGLIAAPFIGSPMAAAGVGALTSGFGTPGSGFNIKRAIMGGIASYGLSNIGAGLEEAGATPLSDSMPISNTDVESQAGGFYGNEGKTNQLLGKGDNFFRSPEAMSKGASNFMGSGTYDKAATAFGSKAGMPSATAALMGTTSMMGIDETEKQLKADKAAADAANATYQEQMAKIAAGKTSAERAIKAYPYQFAVGGSVDDEPGMDEAIGLPQGNLQNGFMGGAPAMSYALGGPVEHYFGGGATSSTGPAMGLVMQLQNGQIIRAEDFPAYTLNPVGDKAAQDAAAKTAEETAAKVTAQKIAMNTPYMVKNPLNSNSNTPYLNASNVYDYMATNEEKRNKGYAMGGNVGNPRFLSGGGDGMSDSIKATIDNKREARLADGEFVVPADVVSGLGNGSSKAGAKQLYAMMDRVRQSRTGTIKQGKQINPKKVLKV